MVVTRADGSFYSFGLDGKPATITFQFGSLPIATLPNGLIVIYDIAARSPLAAIGDLNGDRVADLALFLPSGPGTVAVFLRDGRTGRVTQVG